METLCPNCGSNRRDIKGTIHTEYLTRGCEDAWHGGESGFRIPEDLSSLYQWALSPGNHSNLQASAGYPVDTTKSMAKSLVERIARAEEQVRTLTQSIQDRARIDAENWKLREEGNRVREEN